MSFVSIALLINIFLLVIILGPLLFKSRIAGVVKNQANRKINATLNFDDVNASLIGFGKRGKYWDREKPRYSFLILNLKS